MFCDRCGMALPDSARFCSGCGRAIVVSTTGAAATPKLDQHLSILGVLWIVRGVMRILMAGWFGLFGARWIGAFAESMSDRLPAFPHAFPLARLIETGIMFGSVPTVVIGVASIVAGWGLLERVPWARMLTVVLAFLALLRLPFGTALGIYTLLVLFPEPARIEYERLAHPA
jgi:hypothetical protein